MLEIPASYLIYVICLVGAGIHCHYTGRRVGAENTLDYLQAEGYIDLEDE